MGRLDWLGRADGAAAKEIERTVVRNAEQPGAQRRCLLQLVERDQGSGEGVLHHILAVDHRAHQARAIAVKLRPQCVGERPELRLALG